jgi:hypothetical protein
MAPEEKIAQIERETITALDGASALVERHDRLSPTRRARLGRLLRDLGRSVARPAVFALAGEFNSGKSTLSNRLSGIDALPTDLFANTSVPTRLHWADGLQIACLTVAGRRVELAPKAALIDEPLVRIDVGAPVPFLRDIELLDLPGLADPDAARDEADIVASRADGLIWCTPVTQAWKETENAVWSRLPARLKRRTVVALTFRDLVVDDEEIERVRDRLERDAGPFRALVAISGARDDPAGHDELNAACRDLAGDMKLDRMVKVTRLSERILRRLSAEG